MEVIKDEFKTILDSGQGTFKDKGSKFLAYAFHVTDEEMVNDRLSELKSLHPKARHICYAYQIGINDDRFRINDDGEPSGTAGRPIYSAILSADITDVVIAVVRYFGGTKLGVSGLINAYKLSSRDALTAANIITKFINDYAKIHFNPNQTGKVYNSLKHTNIEIIDQQLGMKNWIKIGIRKSKYKEVTTQFLSHFHGLSKDHILHDSFESSLQIEQL
ncbi:MAG: YigZ family protein [Saprospiraceae bacterium]